MHAVRDGKWKRLKPCLAVSILLTLLLTGNWMFVVAAEDANGVLRSRAYKFNHITSQQAQEMLSQLKIGKSFDVLTDNVLIVTSDKGSDLIKASSAVSVLDQPAPAGIRVLLVKTDQQPLPDIDVLSTEMQTFTVGTMTDAPPKGSNRPVILDILDNKLIAIAAEEFFPEIEKIFEEWKEANPPQSPSEPMVEDEAVDKEQPETTEAATEEQEPQPQEAEPEQETAAASESTQEIEQDIPLQEIMVRLLEEEDETVVAETELSPVETVEADEDDLADMFEAEPNTTEEYIGDELLKVLLDEEEKTRPQAAPVEVPAQPLIPVQPAVETVTEQVPQQAESGQEKSLQEAIEMLLKPSPQEQPAQTEKPTQTVSPMPEEAPRRSEAISENLRLQREMALLRQQLNELQAQKTASVEPAEIEEMETEESTPKIVTPPKTTRTEFEKAIGETELETVVDLPQEVQLENLVDLVGKQLGLNYMYDPAILKNQKVFLKIHQGKIKVKDLYGLLESVLRFRGFVMTRRDDLVTILKSGDAGQVASQTDTVFRMPGDPIQPGDIIVSTIFRLENIGVAEAQKMLAGMKLGLNNGFQQIAETNTLIVTDYAYRMVRIEDVLEMIDVAGEEKIFEYRSLKYLQAGDLIAKLNELVAQMEGVSMQVGAAPAAAKKAPTKFTTRRERNPQTGRIETKRVPVTTSQSSPGASAAAGKDKVFIDTDERTNRILMVGTQGQIDTINQLVDTLDVPQHDLKFVREYVIQNVEAIDVVNVLNELGLASLKVSSGGTVSTSATAARRARATPPRGQAPQQQAAASQSTSSVSGAADQPNISIRPATNSLLVNGTEEQHQAIELVIAHVDVVQKDQRTIREYEIQFVDTQEIIDTMTELGIISSQSVTGSSQNVRSTTGRGRTSTAQQQTAAQAGAPTATVLPGLAGEGGSPEDITAQQPQIAVLEATNSLLVYATPRQHKAISLLIAHADRVPETTTTPYVVYALENQDPVELAEVLTKLIQETVEEVGKTSSSASKVQTSSATAGGGGTVPSLEEAKIRIIADEMSYSLIVYANKRNQQWIAELINELDEYRPQVLLDCTLVEITQDEAFKYDLDIITKTYGGSDLNSGTRVGKLEPFVLDGRYADARSTTAATDPARVFTAFFNSEKIQALITAIQSKGYGRVMARPKILVNDNQEGEIKTENTISVAQLKSNIVPTSTATASTAVTTTDVTFNDYNAGVTLTIKPHISKGDMLRLEITLNRTDFTLNDPVSLTDGDSTREFPSPPDRLSTDVTTVSTVPDGTTIILGGLETINQSKGNSKVPILGDLPIIGGLFRGVSDTGEQSRLYVFVKANILRPGDQAEGLEDIRRVSSQNRQAFEEMEKDFQSLQDWPGIDPKPMDPVKILEDDIE